MNLITIGLIAAASALFACGSADASPVLASINSDSVLATPLATVAPGSLAWAGENETMLDINLGAGMVASDDVNVEMMTAIVAPEPPAIVLAGMALGGVLCGRSLLRKKSTKKAAAEDRS